MDWHRATDPKRRITQLVLDVPAGNACEPRFGLLSLPGKYCQLITQPVTAGFFRMSGDPLPFLMARADQSVQSLRAIPFRIAYSFFHLPAGGIFGAFLEFDSPELARESPTPFPILEMTYGLDTEEGRRTIVEGATRQPAHLVFTFGSARGSYESFNPATGRMNSPAAMPECAFDRVFDLPGGVADAFRDEFEALLAHHRSRPVPDYELCMEQLCELFPVSEPPILETPPVSVEPPLPPQSGAISLAALTADLPDSPLPRNNNLLYRAARTLGRLVGK